MGAKTPEDDSRYADLAESILSVAREIRLREYQTEEGAVALTPSNAQVMRYIDAHPGATASDAAEATGLLRSNLSTAVRELEKIGFIERRRDPDDGRGVRLFSTDVAAHGLALIRQQWGSDVRRALGGAKGVDAATALLNRLTDALTDDRRESGLRWSRKQL